MEVNKFIIQWSVLSNRTLWTFISLSLDRRHRKVLWIGKPWLRSV